MALQLSKKFFALILITSTGMSSIFTSTTPPHYEDDLAAAIGRNHDLERVQQIITVRPNEVNAQHHQCK